MADECGHLSLAQVYAALTYYHANREEIEADLAAEEREAARLEREHYQATHRNGKPHTDFPMPSAHLRLRG
jgi:hypothetical protein